MWDLIISYLKFFPNMLPFFKCKTNQFFYTPLSYTKLSVVIFCTIGYSIYNRNSHLNVCVLGVKLQLKIPVWVSLLTFSLAIQILYQLSRTISDEENIVNPKYD